MIPVTDAALALDDVPEEARPHFEQELAGVGRDEQIVKGLHQYLRNQTGLSAGTRRDYVKAAYAIFVDDADPVETPNADAMLRKMRAFVEQSTTKSEAEGDSTD